MQEALKTIELEGFGRKTKTSAARIDTAAVTVTFGGSEIVTVSMKFNRKAVEELKLGLSQEEKEQKITKGVLISPVKNGKVVVVSPDGLESVTNKDDQQLVTATAKTVKLTHDQVKEIYTRNGLSIDEKLKNVEPRIFKLVPITNTYKGIPAVFYEIIDFQRVPEKEPKEKKPRPGTLKMMDDRKKAWGAAEKAKGNKGAFKDYWPEFYKRNPNIKAWMDAERLEGNQPTLKKFETAYPKTTILW
jgi:hypothetical protein